MYICCSRVGLYSICPFGHTGLILQDAGICADISRIEVLINSSRLSSKLQVDLHVSPVTAAWTEDAGESLLPLMILVTFTCRTAGGMKSLASHSILFQIAVNLCCDGLPYHAH